MQSPAVAARLTRVHNGLICALPRLHFGPSVVQQNKSHKRFDLEGYRPLPPTPGAGASVGESCAVPFRCFMRASVRAGGSMLRVPFASGLCCVDPALLLVVVVVVGHCSTFFVGSSHLLDMLECVAHVMCYAY